MHFMLVYVIKGQFDRLYHDGCSFNYPNVTKMIKR